MRNARYFTVTTIVTDHTISEMTPSTFSRVAGTPCVPLTHSWMV